MVLDAILPIFTELIKGPIKYIIFCAQRHICYAFTCDSNVQKLHKVAEELMDKRTRLQRSIEEATRKGDEIYGHVTEWLTSLDRAIEEAQQLITGKNDATKKRRFVGFCPNLKTRYQFSRRVYKNAFAIRNKKESAELISYHLTLKQIIVPSV